MGTAFGIILYAVLAGGCLALFSFIPSMLKYVFSLLALYIAIRFFRKFETIGQRAVFIILSIVFFFVFSFITVAVQYVYFPEMLEDVMSF